MKCIKHRSCCARASKIGRSAARIATWLTVLFVAVSFASAEEDDPFAALIKKRAELASHVQRIKSSVELTLNGDLTTVVHSLGVFGADQEKMRSLAQPELRAILAQVAEALDRQFGGGGRIRDNKSEKEMRDEMIERILTAIYWPDKGAGAERPPQMTKWDEVRKDRDRFRNYGRARAIVGLLSERLGMNEEQRLAIADGLSENWDEAWNSLANHVYANNGHFPKLNDAPFKEHLNKEQLEIWKNTPKAQHRTSGWETSRTSIFSMRLANNPEPRKEWFRDEEKVEIPPYNITTATSALVRRIQGNTRESKNLQPPSLHELGMLGMDSAQSRIAKLIADGAVVNELSSSGITPLHVAGVNGAYANVKLLLQHGADPNVKNDRGKTPSQVAEDYGHRKVVDLIEKFKQPTNVSGDTGSSKLESGVPDDE